MPLRTKIVLVCRDDCFMVENEDGEAYGCLGNVCAYLVTYILTFTPGKRQEIEPFVCRDFEGPHKKKMSKINTEPSVFKYNELQSFSFS